MVAAGVDQAGKTGWHRPVATQRLNFAPVGDSTGGFSEGITGFSRSESVWPRFSELPLREISARLEKSRIGTATVRELIQFAREHFGALFGDRLSTLSSARPAYGGPRLNKPSLRLMLSFLMRQDGWRLPDVLLPPTGNVQAQWRSDGCRIVAQFLPEGEIWFTVMAQGRPRLTGQVAPDEFVAAVSYMAPLAK